jgi:parvulin-like peptidyl-prolyl isomerase
MIHLSKTTVFLTITGAVIAYIVGDIFIFNGPLEKKLTLEKFFPLEIPARVAGQPITQSQLDRATREQLWLEGKSVESLSPADLKVARTTALHQLIDDELLNLEIKSCGEQIPVSEDELNERIRRLAGRFESKSALESAMKTQGIPNEQSLRNRLSTDIQREKFIIQRSGADVKISDDAARQWFTEHQGSLDLPERVQVRHIFSPTLGRPQEEAKRKLDEALVMLTAKKKDFATLAKELSEDPSSRYRGGELGWMSRNRLPDEFSATVFSLEINSPTLIRTKLGWHLVEVTGHQATEPRNFEQAKPEILAALETIQRRDAIARFRVSLRNSRAFSIEISDEFK